MSRESLWLIGLPPLCYWISIHTRYANPELSDEGGIDRFFQHSLVDLIFFLLPPFMIFSRRNYLTHRRFFTYMHWYLHITIPLYRHTYIRNTHTHTYLHTIPTTRWSIPRYPFLTWLSRFHCMVLLWQWKIIMLDTDRMVWSFELGCEGVNNRL